MQGVADGNANRELTGHRWRPSQQTGGGERHARRQPSCCPLVGRFAAGGCQLVIVGDMVIAAQNGVGDDAHGVVEFGHGRHIGHHHVVIEAGIAQGQLVVAPLTIALQSPVVAQIGGLSLAAVGDIDPMVSPLQVKVQRNRGATNRIDSQRVGDGLGGKAKIVAAHQHSLGAVIADNHAKAVAATGQLHGAAHPLKNGDAAVQDAAGGVAEGGERGQSHPRFEARPVVLVDGSDLGGAIATRPRAARDIVDHPAVGSCEGIAEVDSWRGSRGHRQRIRRAVLASQCVDNIHLQREDPRHRRRTGKLGQPLDG